MGVVVITRKMKWLPLLLLYTISLNATAAIRGENCKIQIRTQQYNGERHQITFGTKLRNKRECERLARMHTRNFDPERISRKNVSFRFQNYR